MSQYQPLVGVNPPFPTRFECEVAIKIDWPHVYRYNDQSYFATGKLGTDLQTDMPAAEYKLVTSRSDIRIWLLSDGTVRED